MQERLNEDLSPTTVAGVVGVLRTALGVAVRDGRLLRNPAAGIRAPKADREPDTPIDAAEARAILAAVKGDRHEAEYSMLLLTGLRRGELLGLRWGDVDWGSLGEPEVQRSVERRAHSAGKSIFGLPEGASLSVRVQRRPVPKDIRREGQAPLADVPLKTRQSRRTIPLSAAAVAVLRKHRARQSRLDPAARIFDAAPSTLTAGFPMALERAGLRHRRLHDLRHAHATLLLRAGIPMRVISDQLGHSSMAITAGIYTHVIPAAQREAADRLDELLRDAK